MLHKMVHYFFLLMACNSQQCVIDCSLTVYTPVVSFLDGEYRVVVLAIAGRLSPSLSQVMVGLGDPEKTQVRVTSSCSRTVISMGPDSTVGGTVGQRNVRKLNQMKQLNR